MSDESNTSDSSMVDRLYSLANPGRTKTERLDDYQRHIDLADPILRKLSITDDVPPEDRERLLRTVFSNVAAQARAEAIGMLNDPTMRPPGVRLDQQRSFQVAAAGELLGCDDQRLRERARKWSYRSKEGEWTKRVTDPDNAGRVQRRRLHAGIWVGGLHPKTMSHESKQRELFSAFEVALWAYVDKRREQLRAFVLDRSESPPPDSVVVSVPTQPVTAPPEPFVESADNEDERVYRSIDPQLQRTLNELADVVRRQWQDEQRQRERHDFLLPTRWENAPRHYADHWVNIARDSSGPTESPVLDDTLDRIADTYLLIPSGRLVVLGQGGAGKSTLAVELLLGLLAPERRSSGERVPMIFNLASWTPGSESFESWMTKRLIADRQALKVTTRLGKMRSTIAAQLVDDHHILPILDGFDEIAPSLRSTALRMLERYGGRIVVTSRTQEYYGAVDASGVLKGTAVVELQDLTLDDIAAYLPRTARPLPNGSESTTKWDPVLSHLQPGSRDAQGAMLLGVFTTPLMVSLARAVYSDTAADPMDLLDTESFPDAGVVSDHLMDQFVRVRYDDLLQDETRKRHKSWRSDDAQRWLGYLAVLLHAQATRDFAWWEIVNAQSGMVLRLLCMPIALVGLIPLLSKPGSYPQPVAFLGWAFVIIAGGLAVGPNVTPRRLGLRHIGAARLSRSEREVEFASVFLSVLYGIVFVSWTTPILKERGWAQTLPELVAFAFAAPLILTVLATGPPSLVKNISPASLLRGDRVAALARGTLYGICYTVFVWVFLAAYGRTLWADGIPLVLVAAIISTFLSSASGQWFTACIWPGVMGQLPWPRTMSFMEDAHRRGILRQSGGVYQFRHASLQYRLAANFLDEFRPQAETRWTYLYARANLAVARFESEGFDLADVELRRVVDLHRRAGNQHGVVVTRILLIEVLNSKGQGIDALCEARSLRKDGADAKVRRLYRTYQFQYRIRQLLAELLAQEGELVEASAEYSELLELVEKDQGRNDTIAVSLREALSDVRGRLVSQGE